MESKTAFRDARRHQESFLARIEKRALVAMAERLPAWVNPDHLTILGILAQLLVGIAYWMASLNRWWLVVASVGLVINWFGDSLDGTLARVRNRLRPRYGFYVDHVLDTFGVAFLLGGLALSSYMSPLIALATLAVYLMLNIEVYLATYCVGTFQMSHWKFSPTELRLLLILGNTVLLWRSRTSFFGPDWLIYDIGAVIGMAGMGLVLLIAFIRHTRQLYREETH